MNTLLKRPTLYYLLGAIVVGFVLGALLFRFSDKHASHPVESSPSDSVEVWTCSMHPQVRKQEPGQCPICGMDLIPASRSEGGLDPNGITMSETALKLADIQTWIVGRTDHSKVLRLNGKIEANERLERSQPAHISGRIEGLSVDFTGQYVDEGDELARIYSPELLNAQKELQLAAASNDSSLLMRSAIAKLRYWKLTEAQINGMLDAESADGVLTIKATTSGYVTRKRIKTGDYVQQGDPLLDLVSLSSVWAMLDVYEEDLGWIQTGDRVTILVGAYPGKSWEGRITFINPIVDPATRIISARVEVPNPIASLKPGMFATGVVRSKDQDDDQIVVPQSAVMWTGKRSVVYVKRAVPNRVSFSMRQVYVGPDLGDHYVIDSGLTIGEEIAVHGTFTIDAAAQLEGKPSMMQQNAEVDGRMETHGHSMEDHSKSHRKVSESFRSFLSSYDLLQSSLAKDDLYSAKSAVVKMKERRSYLDPDLREKLQRPLEQGIEDKDLITLRKVFKQLSDLIVPAAREYSGYDEAWYVQFCPMADQGHGAYWLSRTAAIKNPYFGSAMLKCGSTKDTLQ